MNYSEAIMMRRSSRNYLDTPLSQSDKETIEQGITRSAVPFGNIPRFSLLAAGKGDADSLRGLGTYGFIKNPAAFIAGAVKGDGPMMLEDFGFAMEYLVLHATAMGLGTCWLGGSFTRSSFGARMSLLPGEIIPAVIAIGHRAKKTRVMDSLIRRSAGSDARLPREELFFSEEYGTHLSEEEAGPYEKALQLLRVAPSASNRQPWRVVKRNDSYHFYLARTRGYYSRNRLLFGFADLQRVDMGIAMCHFQTAARDLGLSGGWKREDPRIPSLPVLTEYTATWDARRV